MQTIYETEMHSPKSGLLSLSSSTSASASMAREAVAQVNQALLNKVPSQVEVAVNLGLLLFAEEVMNDVLEACHLAGYRTRYSVCNHECTLMLGA